VVNQVAALRVAEQAGGQAKRPGYFGSIRPHPDHQPELVPPTPQSGKLVRTRGTGA